MKITPELLEVSDVNYENDLTERVALYLALKNKYSID